MPRNRIRPHRDLVVVAPDKRPTETASGIILPESSEPATTGIVIAVGPSAAADGFAAGDQIVFARYGGNPIAIDGVDLVVLPSDQILGWMDPPEDPRTERIRAIMSEIPAGRLADMTADDVAAYVQGRLDSEGGDHAEA